MRQFADRLFIGLLEAAPDAMVCVGRDGRIVLVNAQAERLFGYRREELIGEPVEILVPDGTKAVHPSRREEYLADPRPRPMGVGMELAGRRRDGGEFPAEISLSAVDTDDGILVMAAVRDVTEQRQAAALFRGMVEAAPDATVWVGRDGRIVLVNAQVERLFGYRREELIGEPVEILVPDRAKAVHPSRRGEYLADPRPRPMGVGMELAGRRRDGGEFPAEISLSAVDTGSGFLVMAAVRDVTERLELHAARERLKTQVERAQLERQLQQSQRLESLGQLAGGVAHDFNNLLSVISSYAVFAREEVTKEATEITWQAVRDDIQQIEQAAGRAAALTHQLLAFGRREVVQARALNLNDVVSDMEQLLVRTLGEHIELRTELADALSLVLADPGQLEQILVNLAVNARDAMPGGGTLTIRSADTHIDDEDDPSHAGLPAGRYVSLTVSDTGTGMPEEVTDRVFEPFFTTKPKGEGTGLGLATVHGIVTQAGGWVDISSEPGVGTTFTILLPTTDAAALPERLQQVTQPAKGSSSQTVLLVEDEAALREVARRMLVRNGYKVITAANGREAVNVAAKHQGSIDLLITDVIMPLMLGTDAAEKIREMHPSVRVLFMSGYTGGLLGQRVLQTGVHLINKPFTEASLLAKLGEVLSADQIIS
jgi:PAS domain S-box-containing protein